MIKILNIFVLFLLTFNSINVKADQIREIQINGNQRISDDTIKVFSGVEIGQKLDDVKLNKILRNIYESLFFKDVSVEFKNDKLTIEVQENPIIENINYSGVKAKKILEEIRKDRKLKPRSSYNEFLFKEDKKNIINILKGRGYYFSKVETFINELEDNKVNLDYKISLGEKSKIKKITFVGNKVYKNKKLRSIIVSEEFKFWKIISGKKFLNENIIKFDERLLRNFYLNKGYYNVQINSSFAKLIDENEFELIFNIEANEKVNFNSIKLDLPKDFDVDNFTSIVDLFDDMEGTPYSINKVEKILEEIEVITINEQNLSVKASVDENITENKLDIIFKIDETEKYFVNKINIFGNNITEETVIRNQFEIDEGDPFNDILQNKTVNNIKNLNFFKTVNSEIITNEENKSKDINITVKEKPTGEIFAGAGAGTDGGSLSVGVKENNYLGKGLRVKAEGTLTSESFKGQFNVTNPNFKNSDKSIFFNLQALELDRLKASGYKTNKTGFDIGSGFEFYDDLYLNLATRSYYEKIETNSSASQRQKKQEGDYWDSFLNLNFDLDKRNQKFKTSSGYRSSYGIDIPVISETNTLTNKYFYKHYAELYDENISSFAFYASAANSLTGEDIKLSERLYIPVNRLRGFQKGKVGPKDGKDYIGGNFITSVNFASTIPQALPNMQEIDISIFADAANVWGVDYDSSLNDGSKIRSSVGIGIDWFTVIGPINFTFAEAISKSDTDATETFRFNIGTSF